MLTSILAAVAPVIILLTYIYSKDRKAPEPTDLLFKSFRYGLLSALAVMVIMAPFSINTEPDTLLQAVSTSFFGAGIPEEFAKWIFLYILIWRSTQFDEYIDGIVYAVFIAMGFACLENVLYVLEGGMGVAFTRALLSVPAHFLFGVVMGYFFSMARFVPEQRTRYMVLSIAVPVVMHGCFDTLAFWMDTLDESYYIGVFVLFILFDIYLWRAGIRAIRKSVAMSEQARTEAEELSFVLAQEAAEKLPAARPVDGSWQDTPVAMFHTSAGIGQEGADDQGTETQMFKLLIESKADAKIFINEKDAFFTRSDTNYRLTLPAGSYTLRAVNLNRYEQMVTMQVELNENKRVTLSFSRWEQMPSWARTLIIGGIVLAAYYFIF